MQLLFDFLPIIVFFAAFKLADMYEADARFAASIDAYAPGLTAWWSSAIRANAR